MEKVRGYRQKQNTFRIWFGFHKIEQLIFLGSIPWFFSSEEILNIMTRIRSEEVQFKIVPDSMDSLSEKAMLSSFDDVPVVDVRVVIRYPIECFS